METRLFGWVSVSDSSMLDNWTTILHLVGAGLGVTVAPVSATATAPDNVRIIPFRGSPSTSEVQYIRRSNDTACSWITSSTSANPVACST